MIQIFLTLNTSKKVLEIISKFFVKSTGSIYPLIKGLNFFCNMLHIFCNNFFIDSV
jgi:hypothetical protein